MIRFCLDTVAKRRGFNSIKALAEASGIGYTSVLMIWSNRYARIDVRTLDTLCRVLRCQPGDLMVYEADEVEQEAPPVVKRAAAPERIAPPARRAAVVAQSDLDPEPAIEIAEEESQPKRKTTALFTM